MVILGRNSIFAKQSANVFKEMNLMGMFTFFHVTGKDLIANFTRPMAFFVVLRISPTSTIIIFLIRFNNIGIVIGINLFLVIHVIAIIIVVISKIIVTLIVITFELNGLFSQINGRFVIFVKISIFVFDGCQLLCFDGK